MGGNGYRHSGSSGGGTGGVVDKISMFGKGGGAIQDMATQEQLSQMRQDYKGWSKNLDQYQKEAIVSYIHGGYQEMNSYLRQGGKMTALDAPLELQDMQDALMSGRTNAKAVVYRGLSENYMSFEQAMNMRGSVGVDPAFGSASMDFRTALQFTGPNGNAGGYHVIRQITMPKGSRGGWVGGSEKEFVMPAGARMQTTGVQTGFYRDPMTGERMKVLILHQTYLGVAGARGRPRTPKW